jgi:hypothetical protein
LYKKGSPSSSKIIRSEIRDKDLRKSEIIRSLEKEERDSGTENPLQIKTLEYYSADLCCRVSYLIAFDNGVHKLIIDEFVHQK